MKGIKLFALCAMAAMAVSMVSCNKAAAPRTNLRTSIDSTSYAWGVSLTEGLPQYMEQLGVIQSTNAIEQDFAFRMMTADSTQRVALERQKRAAIDSLNKVNGPKMNEFIKGMLAGARTESGSAYAQGFQVGIQLSQQMIPGLNHEFFGENSSEMLNVDQILAGMIGSLRNSSLAMTTEEANAHFTAALEAAQAEVMARQEEEMRLTNAEALAVGEAFMRENATKEGVVTLPSGLQYRIITEGTGPKPTITDRVTVHYHGTLIDGEVFDSSVNRGDPATFGVSQVIPGWTEALQLMPVGSKWILYIPYDLAYGSQDRGIIRPFSNLIFEVELLRID